MGSSVRARARISGSTKTSKENSLRRTEAGLRVDHRHPVGTVPRGEAANVHDGGRYISIIGSNDLFHNTSDRGPDTVDLAVIERFAGAFARVATSLCGA